MIAVFFNSNAIDLALGLVVLVLLILLGALVIRKTRAALLQKEPKASELMSKFQEWHEQGGLSDAEFRTIKTTLAERLQEELKDEDETA